MGLWLLRILPSQTRPKPCSNLVLRSQVFPPLDNQ